MVWINNKMVKQLVIIMIDLLILKQKDQTWISFN